MASTCLEISLEIPTMKRQLIEVATYYFQVKISLFKYNIKSHDLIHLCWGGGGVICAAFQGVRYSCFSLSWMGQYMLEFWMTGSFGQGNAASILVLLPYKLSCKVSTEVGESHFCFSFFSSAFVFPFFWIIFSHYLIKIVHF